MSTVAIRRSLLSLLLLIALGVPVVLSMASAQDGAEPAAPDGAELYQLFCAACHMSDGRGAEGAGRYPNLAGNAAAAASPELIILRVLRGFGAMPAFASLNDAQVAAIVNHVRGTLNDVAEEIGPEQVEAHR